MLTCILIQNKKIRIEQNKFCIIIVNFNQLINQELNKHKNQRIINQRLFQNICLNKYYLKSTTIKINNNQLNPINQKYKINQIYKHMLFKNLKLINLELQIEQKVIVFYKNGFKYFQKMPIQNHRYIKLIMNIQNLKDNQFV